MALSLRQPASRTVLVVCASNRSTALRSALSVQALTKLCRSNKSKYTHAELCTAFESAATLAARASSARHGMRAPTASGPPRSSSKGGSKGTGRKKGGAATAQHACEDPHVLMHALHLDLLPVLGKCSTRQLCQLVRAMGRAGYIPQQAFLQGIIRRLCTALEKPPTAATVLQQSPRAQQPGQPVQLAQQHSVLCPRELCDIAEGLSKLPSYDADVFELLARDAERGIAAFSAQECTTLALSLARALHCDDRLMALILDKVASATAGPDLYPGPDPAPGPEPAAEAEAAPVLSSAGPSGLRPGLNNGPSWEAADTTFPQPVAAQPPSTSASSSLRPGRLPTASAPARAGAPIIRPLVCNCLSAAATFGLAGAPGAVAMLQTATAVIMAAAPVAAGAMGAGAALDVPLAKKGVKKGAACMVGGLPLRQAAPLVWAAGMLGHVEPGLYRGALLLCPLEEEAEGGGQGAEAQPPPSGAGRGSGVAADSTRGTGGASSSRVRSLAMLMQGLLAAAAAAGDQADEGGVRRLLGLPHPPPDGKVGAEAPTGSFASSGHDGMGGGAPAEAAAEPHHSPAQHQPRRSPPYEPHRIAAHQPDRRGEPAATPATVHTPAPSSCPPVASHTPARPAQSACAPHYTPAAAALVEQRLQLCLSAWRQLALRSRPSATQLLVLRALQGMPGVMDAAAEVLTADRMFCLDVACRWHSTPVVVEVDGPLHACANAPDRLLGASTARTAMLRSLGYAVARVPVNEWHSLADGGKVGRETEQLAARPGGGQGHVEVEVNVANRGMHEALKSYLEDKLLMAGSLTS